MGSESVGKIKKEKKKEKLAFNSHRRVVCCQIDLYVASLSSCDDEILASTYTAQIDCPPFPPRLLGKMH